MNNVIARHIGRTPGICGQYRTALAFSRDGRWLACGGFHGSLRLWDVESKKAVHDLRGHRINIHSLVFGTHVLASAAGEDKVKFWNIQMRMEVPSGLAGQKLSVGHLAFSPDGTMLAACTLRSQIFIWDTASWNLLSSFRAYGNVGISALASTPDGTALLTASSGGTFDDQQFDGQIDVWKVK